MPGNIDWKPYPFLLVYDTARHHTLAVGANDEQGIITGHQVLNFNTPSWREVYARRIDSLVGLLRRNGAAVYWVGLPRMRRDSFDQRSQVLNALYSSRAQALNVPFIPTRAVALSFTSTYAPIPAAWIAAATSISPA